MVEIAIPYRTELTQQNGYLHAGVVTTIADSACGYAAYSLMPAGSEVLSVEFKVNLLRPAKGDRFLAHAEVIKPGSHGSEGRCVRRIGSSGEPDSRSFNVGNDFLRKKRRGEGLLKPLDVLNDL
jgi:hypothetical protein